MLNRKKKILYILELTVGFESNLEVNSTRKSAKFNNNYNNNFNYFRTVTHLAVLVYKGPSIFLPLIQTLKATDWEVKFINVSMVALGALDKPCDFLLAMLNDLDTIYNLKNRIIPKIMNISIRCTYYIISRRNKDWTDLTLMDL